MNSNNFLPAVFMVAMIIIIIIVFAAKNKLDNEGNFSLTGIVLFFREECSPCKAVEAYLEENKVGQKVRFESKEVSNNKENAALLASAAKKCGLGGSSVSVPFVWDGSGSKCYSGKDEIMVFFKSKMESLP